MLKTNSSLFQGTLKGLLPQQLEQLDCQIILGNTYHLGNRPVRIDNYYASSLREINTNFYLILKLRIYEISKILNLLQIFLHIY